MDAPRKHQVSLRGASAKEITRDDLLQKVSRERELRNYAKRAAAAALFIQRVWRRFKVTKVVALQLQEEWETMVNHYSGAMTAIWISNNLLRPFLFFMTCFSTRHQKVHKKKIDSMKMCFTILLESLKSSDSKRNFCVLAVGTSEERRIWSYQARRLTSLGFLILQEFSECNSGAQDITIVTSLAMRVLVMLTDLKGWKGITDDNRLDADLAVKDLVQFMGSNKSGPGMLDINHAAKQYVVYLLTIPWLVQHLPPVLLPALKHKSILFPCFQTLLILKENVLMEMSELVKSKILTSFKAIPPVGWALANIICLATGNGNGSVDSGSFNQGLDYALYVQVVITLAESLITCLDNIGWVRKKKKALQTDVGSSTQPVDMVLHEGEGTYESLMMSYTDQFRPVCQQWHLTNLLASITRDATNKADTLLSIDSFFSGDKHISDNHTSENGRQKLLRRCKNKGVKMGLISGPVYFINLQVPFKIEQQRRIASMLNTLVYNGLSHVSGHHNKPLMDCAVRCLHLMYERDCRHPFCPPDLWLSPARKSRPPIAVAARTHEILSANPKCDDSSASLSEGSVITVTPHVFPFEERVEMFREFIKMDKASRKMAGEISEPGSRAIEIVAGLDYGGLSKEFLTDISKAAFAPEYGLFSQTSNSDRLLIPTASARYLDNGLQMIEFLGRVVGKALYEGILLDYSFSHVFVQKLLGRYSFLDELSTLDPELYRNLMHMVELKSGGKDISVTNENKMQYIHAIADYKLNQQMLPFSNAFYRGLTDLISPSWLKLFNANEFNQLLSGGNYDIDIDDLKNNTRYTGGYSEGSRTIKIFWEVIKSFEPKERCMLLKFVTSCSRAPLLGFKYLQPPFTIHKVACDVPLWATLGGQDVERLPSASTCYNTLKLPTYKRPGTLRTKVLYAISSNAGFELS
ncbi:HECT, E3 ligase catalytic domain [Sesbania bispinosa]|nr:HECT, E3 ligase catalytic domain [Sesbania bispinosa]